MRPIDTPQLHTSSHPPPLMSPFSSGTLFHRHWCTKMWYHIFIRVALWTPSGGPWQAKRDPFLRLAMARSSWWWYCSSHDDCSINIIIINNNSNSNNHLLLNHHLLIICSLRRIQKILQRRCSLQIPFLTHGRKHSLLSPPQRHRYTSYPGCVSVGEVVGGVEGSDGSSVQSVSDVQWSQWNTGTTTGDGWRRESVPRILFVVPHISLFPHTIIWNTPTTSLKPSYIFNNVP